MDAHLPSQPGILAPVPAIGRHLTFDLRSPIQAGAVAEALAALEVDEHVVVGLGPALVSGLGHQIPGLAPLRARTAPGVTIPVTGGAVWVYIRADAAGTALDIAADVRARLGDAVTLQEDVACFLHDGGRDLTGYEDGTENPRGDGAVAAAIVSGVGEGLDGGSFGATQRWVHELAAFRSWPRATQDHAIGRARDTNEEIDDAPPSAHVKRSAQETFAPAAFMVRRSMPYGDATERGLYFVAFGHSLHAFERVLSRMVGEEDGIVDALFRFSRPVTGASWWCPPCAGTRLDLRRIGL
jgi:porphyrinogen peroxidase